MPDPVAPLSPLDSATQAWFSLLDQQHTPKALDLFCTRIVPLLLPTVRSRFIAEHPISHAVPCLSGSGEDPIPAWRYRGIISLLGYTPDTSILVARFAEAERLVLLHTPETTRYVEDVRSYAGLPPERVTAILFDRARASDLERAFLEALSEIASVSPVAVEVTGGTKPMSTALHVAAALADLDTLYVDYDQYDPRYRKPVPGSIHVRRMASPLRPEADPAAAAESQMTVIARIARAAARRLEGDPEAARVQTLAHEAEAMSAMFHARAAIIARET